MYTMIRLLLATLSLVIGFTSYTQIVSSSSSDLYIDSTGWQGKIDLHFYNSQNKTNVVSLITGSQIQYLKDRHRFLSLNALTQLLVASDGQPSDDDKGVQHFRYNYIFNRRWEFETFIQGQYNEPLRIGFRGLLGVGARAVFHKNEKDYFYAGAGPMFDHEREIGNGITTNEMRLNSYISLKRKFSEMITATFNFYYQPQFIDVSDYRLMTGGTFKLSASQKLGVKTTLNLNYDSSPVIDPEIHNFTYTFITGFFYKF